LANADACGQRVGSAAIDEGQITEAAVSGPGALGRAFEWDISNPVETAATPAMGVWTLDCIEVGHMRQRVS
jgi:hypothetical protein